MGIPIYLSTGAFTGSRNGYNHRLAIDYAQELECDGFEVLIFEDWYDRSEQIIKDYRDINIPVVHADKVIGDLLSLDDEAVARAYQIMQRNCVMAQAMGAKKMVIHIWGLPHSDKYHQRVYERVGKLWDMAYSHGLDLLIENSFTAVHTPLYHLECLMEMYPKLGFTLDTRFAQFYHELEDICSSEVWSRVRHIHISDYRGGYMEWEAAYPILQPGQGDIDFQTFYAYIKAIYSGSVTLEAPSFIKYGVDVDTLNASLRKIRSAL